MYVISVIVNISPSLLLFSHLFHTCTYVHAIACIITCTAFSWWWTQAFPSTVCPSRTRQAVCLLLALGRIAICSEWAGKFIHSSCAIRAIVAHWTRVQLKVGDVGWTVVARWALETLSPSCNIVICTSRALQGIWCSSWAVVTSIAGSTLRWISTWEKKNFLTALQAGVCGREVF